MSDYEEICENCDAPEPRHVDSEGVPLCDKCMADLVAETIRDEKGTQMNSEETRGCGTCGLRMGEMGETIDCCWPVPPVPAWLKFTDDSRGLRDADHPDCPCWVSP